MKIEVTQIEDTDHVHTDKCIEQDVVDLGDDGDGYQAFPILVCSVTGETIERIDS